MILAEPQQSIEEIMDRTVISVRASADQEEVAQLLQRYDLVALPVVDDEGKLIGIVHVDDVVDVLEEEATEDIYKLAQVSPDSEIYSPIRQSIRNRLPWLVINLGTAFLASAVVSLFQNTIAQAAVLAAFMPIVAGQGGNAGTQTMTIVVRSLALKEIAPKDTLWALWHEARVGIINGLTIGVLVGLIAWLLERQSLSGACHWAGHAGQLDRGCAGRRLRADGAKSRAHRPGAGLQHFCHDLYRRDGILFVLGAGDLFPAVDRVATTKARKKSI